MLPQLFAILYDISRKTEGDELLRRYNAGEIDKKRMQQELRTIFTREELADAVCRLASACGIKRSD